MKESQMVETNPAQENKETSDSIQKQECTWATFCHLSSLVAFIGIPFGNIIGPLVIWLIKKNEMPLVDQEGKAALNFQISMTIYALISGVLTIVCIGPSLLAAVCIVDLIFLLIASVKANNGEHYRYPLTIRFIK